jgi:hypothetical protein
MNDSKIIPTSQTEIDSKLNESRKDLREELIHSDSKGNTIQAINLSTEVSLDNSQIKIDNEIRKMLEEKNIDISQYLYLDQIISILDSLNNRQIFNRVLLIHIVEFGQLNKEHPIELRSFFTSYFNVYENMKTKRVSYINQLIEMKKSLENLQRRMSKHKNEVIYENGLTSNSCLKFQIRNLSYFSKFAERDNCRLVVEDIEKKYFISVFLDHSILYKKYKL